MANLSRQYLAAFCVNLATFGWGLTVAWSSPSLPFLMSEESPLDSGPVTKEQATWIGSIVCIGGAIGAFFYGLAVERFGRKPTMFLIAVPQIISWLLIAIGSNHHYLIASRLLGGFSAGGIFVAVPIFVSEISEEK